MSIVVPVYNAEETLEACLRSLVNQTYPNKEIIVVDDGSQDRSAEIALQHDVTYVRIRHSGRAASRNAGIRHSTGEIIFQCDADAFYAANYVEFCVGRLTEDARVGSVIGYGHAWPHESTLSHWWEQSLRLRQVGYVPKGGWFYRKQDLLSVGLYDESLNFGEDADLCDRLRGKGYIFVHETKAEWSHRESYSFSQIFRRAFQKGLGIVDYERKNRRQNKEFVKSLARLLSPVIVIVFALLALGIFGLASLLVFPAAAVTSLYFVALIQVVSRRQPLLDYGLYILIFPLVQMLQTLGYSAGYACGFLSRSFGNG